MDSGKNNLNTHKAGKKKGIFMRLMDWIAKGAEKSQGVGGGCSS